ncbi:hypothetical protein BBJ28_00017994 [Nothophytophthora sp. Chile5]|nr:hypothetical protein BBJ28_00017994 [Nothophytophthora sp. Chile5]
MNSGVKHYRTPTTIYKKYAPTATTAAEATPSVLATCEAPLEPEADAEADESLVVAVPVDDESVVDDEAVVVPVEDESVVAVAEEESAVTVLEPVAMLEAVTSPVVVDPAAEAPVAAAVSVPAAVVAVPDMEAPVAVASVAPEVAVAAPVVEAPVVVAAAVVAAS